MSYFIKAKDCVEEAYFYMENLAVMDHFTESFHGITLKFLLVGQIFFLPKMQFQSNY